MFPSSYRASRFQDLEGNRRQTLWPTANGDGIQISTPWHMPYDAAAENNQRITSVFDTEGRAARMSAMVDSSLFPPSLHARNRHSAWAGKSAQRQTWLATAAVSDSKERVWSGEFDVERRPSWQSRASNRWSDKLDAGDFNNDAKEPYPVAWEEGDTENPLNFGTGRKWFNAMLLAFACFVVSIASSGFSQSNSSSSQTFNPQLTQ